MMDHDEWMREHNERTAQLRRIHTWATVGLIFAIVWLGAALAAWIEKLVRISSGEAP